MYKKPIFSRITLALIFLLPVKTSSAYLPWPMLMHDARRTGCFENVLNERGTMDSAFVKWTSAINTLSASPVIGDIDDDSEVEIVVGGAMEKCVYALKGIDGTVKWSSAVDSTIYGSSAALGDIDKDNDIDVVIGTEGGTIFALRGDNGNVKWSRKISDTLIASSPAIANVDADTNTVEIVVVLSDTTACLNGNDGSIKWKTCTSFIAGEYSSPAVADLDNNGEIEIVLASADTSVRAIKGEDGTLKWRCITEYVGGSGIPMATCIPAIEDLDDDGLKEIGVHHGGVIFLINGFDGSVKWSQGIGSNTGTAANPGLSAGNIDADPNKEIVCRSGYRIYGLDENTGTTLWSYTFTGTFPVVNPAPVLADFDGDSKLEALGANHEGSVACLEGENGNLKWEIRPASNGDIHSTHAIGDIDGDGCFEVVGASLNGPVYALEADCPQPVEETGIRIKNNIKITTDKNKISIRLSIDNPCQSKISIIDISGKTIKTMDMGTLTRGTYEVNISSKEHSSGIYFVKFVSNCHSERREESNTIKITKKLILIK